MSLTQARLKELLTYDRETGRFTRLVATTRSPVGTVAGTVNGCGYVVIRIGPTVHYAHRLAWLYMTGDSPIEIDHVDGQRSNNAATNLRPADRFLNMQNQRIAKADNKLGVLGVSKRKTSFSARIVVDGEERHLGNFPTASEAHAVYVNAKRALHEGCTL